MSEQSITNVDIQLCVRIIDISASRGAFRGEELEEIGKLRTKLVSYLESLNKEQNDDVEKL